MAGPAVQKLPQTTRRVPQFGTATQKDLEPFIGLMQVLHTEPNASAYARLLARETKEEDKLMLAHLFEEMAVLVRHGLIVEDLLFDAFAFDHYWDELKGAVKQVRKKTGNDKFCENFELSAGVATMYREARPHKN